MKSFRSNLKAISPIFATLILIAIAVIAGVVVYMFTSGTLASMTSAGTAGQEKAALQGASSNHSAIVYAQYISGGNPIDINGAICKDANGAQVVATSVSGDSLATDGTLTTITVTAGLESGHTYTVTLTSAKGGSFVSPSFTVA